MTKVLGLALYGSLAASNRYRFGQYVDGLEKHGIDLQIRHLLSDEYLQARFNCQGLPFLSMLKDCWLRFLDLLNQNEYDLIMLQYELIPFMPKLIERILIQKPYIYDIDDAVYLKYRNSKFYLTRTLYGGKIDAIMKNASAITAGNDILSRYASKNNVNTHYLPTVVDTLRYKPNKNLFNFKSFTIGWIGSPSTAFYLKELVVPLSALGCEGPVRFVVVGGRAPVIPNVEVIEVEWKMDEEIDLINSFDVGVMPLTNDDWARGKCAFKLIQYMACAVPVIASPVGANLDVVNSTCGHIASTAIEWIDALRIFRDYPKLREEMGRAARKRVEENYSLSKNLPILAKIISNLSGKD